MKKAYWIAFGGIAVVCVVVLWSLWTRVTAFPSVPTDRWQAVFLDNGQVYFGKLKNHNATYVTLSDVFYLRYATDLTDAGEKNLNLVKLGGELHGPEDTLFVRKEAILFWENLKPDSRVVTTILSTRR